MYHVSITYRQQCERLGGWTENFWCDQSSALLAAQAGQALATAMDQFHGHQTGSVKVRAQAVPMGTALTIPRDVKTIKQIALTNPPGSAPLTGDSDYPTNAIYLALRAGQRETRQWIKGIQDQWIKQGVLDKAHAGLVSSLAAMLASLKAGKFHIRFLDPTVPKQDVTSIAQDGTITYNGQPLANGTKARISGDQTNGYVNGVWRISSTNVAGVVTTKLAFFNPPLPWIPPTGNIFIRPQSYTSAAIDAYEPLMATEHDIGRPTDLLGGRRKKRKRRLTGTPAVV